MAHDEPSNLFERYLHARFQVNATLIDATKRAVL